ncbi:hypothetical protein ABZW10_38635 [Kitasatospora sp. NPDC004723]|uniref:hypothetical protein n=1 Tax=Kitasatospora sp. NPDC004723 TaxID=3154288 RepID=UPI0033A7BBD6
MSAHSSNRRSRLLATATLVAVTGTAALVPTAAFADAPATGDAKPLVATLAPNAGQAPLVRGGNGAELTMTVTNNSDQDQPFHPSVTVKPVGSAPNNWNWIGFSAKAISAPATSGTATWGANGFAGAVVPENHMASASFTVPAHTTYTWAVSFTLKAALPADDTAVEVGLENDKNDSTNSAPVTLPVAAPTGALVQNFSQWGDVSFKKSFETDLDLTNNGADINSTINPTLRYGDGSKPTPATLKLDVLQGGQWVTVPGSANTWQLPSVTGGLGKGATQHYKLRVSLADFTVQQGVVYTSDWLSLAPNTDQGPIDTAVKALVRVDGTPVTPAPAGQ